MALASYWPMKFSSLPMPMMSGEPRRALTVVPGNSRCKSRPVRRVPITSRKASQTDWVKRSAPYFDRSAFGVIFTDQMREHFRVGIGGELVPGLEQPLFKEVVIFTMTPLWTTAILPDASVCGWGIFIRRGRRAWPSECARSPGCPEAGSGAQWTRARLLVNFPLFFAHQQGECRPGSPRRHCHNHDIPAKRNPLRGGWARPVFFRHIQ